MLNIASACSIGASPFGTEEAFVAMKMSWKDVPLLDGFAWGTDLKTGIQFHVISLVFAESAKFASKPIKFD